MYVSVCINMQCKCVFLYEDEPTREIPLGMCDIRLERILGKVFGRRNDWFSLRLPLQNVTK